MPVGDKSSMVSKVVNSGNATKARFLRAYDKMRLLNGVIVARVGCPASRLRRMRQLLVVLRMILEKDMTLLMLML